MNNARLKPWESSQRSRCPSERLLRRLAARHYDVAQLRQLRQIIAAMDEVRRTLFELDLARAHDGGALPVEFVSRWLEYAGDAMIAVLEHAEHATRRQVH